MQTESDKPTVGLAAAAAEVVATEAEQAALASPVDPLPTPEEIAEAAAATASVRPSSAVEESTTEPALKGLGKGLGGAGLARRKSKPSGSTVSAATAPAALAVRNKKSGAAADAAGPNGVGSSISTNAPIAAGAGSKARKGLSANAAPANSNAAAGGGGGGESVKLDMSSVADDVDEDASGEWESASTDEVRCGAIDVQQQFHQQLTRALAAGNLSAAQ